MPSSVVIIGAGIAGLSAAFRLQRAGFAVQVLESQQQVGGRMGERQSGPIKYNTGARLIYPFGASFHALLAELGMRDALVPLRKLGAHCTVDGLRYHIELMPSPRSLLTPGLKWSSRIGMLTSAARLARLRARADPDAAISCMEGDRETLADYIGRTVGHDVLERMIDPVFRGTRSWNPETISAAFYLSTMPHLLGQDTVYTLAEGMGQVTRELARRVPVTCGAHVDTIERRADGHCIVQYETAGTRHAIEADIVVCATEGARAAALVAAPLEQERAFLSSVRYNSLGVVHYALSGNLAPALDFAPRSASTRISTWQQLPAAPHAGREHAQLYCQLTPEAVAEASRLGLNESLDELIRDEIRARVPDFDARVVTVVNQWIPYKLPLFYPGFGQKVANFLAWQQSGKKSVYYCGDYLSQALLTGACASGTAVAQTIAAHYGR